MVDSGPRVSLGSLPGVFGHMRSYGHGFAQEHISDCYNSAGGDDSAHHPLSVVGDMLI